MYFCVGYTSNNDWSTSEIPLDQYQEKLQERWDELPLGKEIMQLKQQLKKRDEELQKERRMKAQHESLVKAREDELQRLIKEKEQLQEDHHHQLLLRDKEQQEREQQLQTNQATLALQLQQANTLLQQAEKYKKELHKDLKEERQLSSSLMKQKGKQVTASEKDEIIESLKTKLDDEKKEEKKLRKELLEEIESLQQQLQPVKDHKEVGVQFDYLIPQSGMCVCVLVVDMMCLHVSDLIDSSVTIAGQKLFHLQGDRSHSLPWEKYGFILHCPKGAVSKDTEVAVTALVSGSFKVPKGTVLVSAVYAISVSKPLLKSLTIQLQHCVDLRNTGQTGRLKFVRGPLKSPYQLSPVEGGVFTVGKRYGSIKRDQFSNMGIVAEISNGSTPSDSDSEGSATQGIS